MSRSFTGPTTGPLDPVTALRRTAFLLERARESSHRVEAFRGAASTLSRMPGAEVRDRLKAGTLTELPGIGPKTAQVADEAARGLIPAYISRLEESQTWPIVPGGEALRAEIRGDLHLHTNWSDGGSPIEEMVATGSDIGHEYLLITDHSPRLTIANGLSVERLTEQIGVIDSLNEALSSADSSAMRVLKGIEVDILDEGDLDQSAEMFAQLDVVVASVHSKLRMESAAMTRRMIAAVRNPRTNVLGHCTGRLVTGSRGKRPQSMFDAEAVFAACVESHTAVEINSRPERQDPPDDLMALALDMGCLFSIDTDAHAPGQLDFQDYGCARAAAAGIPADRIVNTWPLDTLLTWAKG